MNSGTEDFALSSVSAQAAQAVSQILMSPYMVLDESIQFNHQQQSEVPYLDRLQFSLQTTDLTLSNIAKSKPVDLPKLVTAHFATESNLLSPEPLHTASSSDSYSWQESLCVPPSISMVAHEQADLLNTSFMHAQSQPTVESLSIISETCPLSDEISPVLSPVANNLWSEGGISPMCFAANQTALWVEQSNSQISDSAHMQLYPESPLAAGNADTSSLSSLQHAKQPPKQSPLLSQKAHQPKKSLTAVSKVPAAKSPGRKRQTLSVPQKRVLYTYMVAHMDSPYPNDDERLNELNIDGLSKQRFKWWFSNHRHRSLELCVDNNGNKFFKPKLPFYKACRRLGVHIPWEIPQDIQAKLTCK
ncbi:hypothetical protein IWW36_004026 [Coemansia brasiliensis]|uniref:Homeobox domain-containing protein n=1 Tax=Coemansia brasiliensis TaxID=2650707 RepID=A0A9W8LZ71_9FUNG|nr:hypothetical protein IWW36_004026 [Coemansia brasiliensis]